MKDRALHPYHMVPVSPWPFVVASGLAGFVGGLVAYFSGSTPDLLIMSLVGLVVSFFLWVRDMVREATFLGMYVRLVRKQLRMGFFLFLISEIMLFVSCFWAFFHSGLTPTPWVGCDWPPVGVKVPDFKMLPGCGTGLLLTSGASVTWAHKALQSGKRKSALVGIGVTIFLGLSFTGMQLYEYFVLPFTISDSVFGSCFFLLTGLHGLHVIAGSAGLILSWGRCYFKHFSPGRHLGFQAAMWYWHFVDVMWVGVYLAAYVWGGLGVTWGQGHILW
uniref:cytochrome c oxidase subunit 3 n=1 Tax=Lima vulgaris TaxID=2671060 RepID=UPI0028FCF3C5|nr:cytochrome c oxidase subunit 3 [Lima vulgaris]WNB40315.1 cytochrome c oxidase subunit 3 [Lima vulgaris]